MSTPTHTLRTEFKDPLAAGLHLSLLKATTDPNLSPGTQARALWALKTGYYPKDRPPVFGQRLVPHGLAVSAVIRALTRHQIEERLKAAGGPPVHTDTPHSVIVLLATLSGQNLVNAWSAAMLEADQAGALWPTGAVCNTIVRRIKEDELASWEVPDLPMARYGEASVACGRTLQKDYFKRAVSICAQSYRHHTSSKLPKVLDVTHYYSEVVRKAWPRYPRWSKEACVAEFVRRLGLMKAAYEERSAVSVLHPDGPKGMPNTVWCAFCTWSSLVKANLRSHFRDAHPSICYQPGSAAAALAAQCPENMCPCPVCGTHLESEDHVEDHCYDAHADLISASQQNQSVRYTGISRSRQKNEQAMVTAKAIKSMCQQEVHQATAQDAEAGAIEVPAVVESPASAPPLLMLTAPLPEEDSPAAPPAPPAATPLVTPEPVAACAPIVEALPRAEPVTPAATPSGDHCDACGYNLAPRRAQLAAFGVPLKNCRKCGFVVVP